MPKPVAMNLDDIPDLPAELDDEVDITSPTVSHALSSEDLESMTFDSLDQRDEQNRAKLDPPTGDWEKDDRWHFDSRIQAGNCEPGDLKPEGRTIFSVMGKPKARVANGLEYEPVLFLRISPDVRLKDDNVSLDNAHKLWLKVKDLHLALYEKKLSTLAQLKQMLEEDEYVLRTMKGDNGPIVVDVKVKRAKR
jgi:hypothetical protein